MLKKVIKYEDYDGEQRSETFLFNLTKAEVTEMEMTTDGGMVRFIEKIIETTDKKRLVELFKMIILKSYGEKSPDGKFFIKLDQKGESLSLNFSQSEAYSVLFMELVESTDAAVAFINGVLPKMEPTNN